MPLVPKNIKDLTPYKPGKPVEEIQREKGIKKIYKLSSNENPLGPSPLAVKAIQDSLPIINRYPDAFGYKLRTKLAQKYQIKLENVILGAGSEGIMATIMRTFLLPEDEIITAANSFIGFTILARASGKRIHWVPMKNYHYNLEGMADCINEYTKIIYIANPDNPTGTYIRREIFDEFYAHIPERVLIILDEAYFEFAQHLSDYPDSMHYRYDNVITLRTFSKAYGLAGVRIGYGFAHDQLITNLMKVKPPFEPSSIAQIAGSAALEDREHLNKTVNMIHKELNFFYKAFDQLNIRYLSSSTNFITTIWESAKQAQFICQKALEKGIILRHLDSFGWPNCIRISVGLHEENEKCIETLQSILLR